MEKRKVISKKQKNRPKMHIRLEKVDWGQIVENIVYFLYSWGNMGTMQVFN